MPAQVFRLYPSTVTLPDGSVLSPVLVFEDRESVAFYGRTERFEGEPTRTEAVVRVDRFEGAHVDSFGGGTWFVDVPDGRIEIRDAGGCGCGDVLRGWRP